MFSLALMPALILVLWISPSQVLPLFFLSNHYSLLPRPLCDILCEITFLAPLGTIEGENRIIPNEITRGWAFKAIRPNLSLSSSFWDFSAGSLDARLFEKEVFYTEARQITFEGRKRINCGDAGAHLPLFYLYRGELWIGHYYVFIIFLIV